MMVRFDLLVLLGGVLGYLVSILASTALVLLFYRLNSKMLPGRKILHLFSWDRETSTRPPSPAPAIALGAATLSQAYLLRHVVFVIMTLVQDFLLMAQGGLTVPISAFLRLAGLSLLFLVVMSALAVLSVWIAGAFFTRMTGELDEMQEIMNGNVAVAILFAFVLFAVTAILNEGIEDISRALIPYNRPGVIRLP